METKTRKKYVRGMTIDEDIAERMKDLGFRKAWRDLDAEFELMESMIKARAKAGISQGELARKIGTKQPALSRLERGGFSKATVETLNKIADALDMRLVVKLQKKQRRS
jgi:ribosome-binding protein aMBF1 (putative translation factor)